MDVMSIQMEEFSRTDLLFSKFSFAVHQSFISIPEDGSVSGRTIHNDHGKLVCSIGFDGHRRDIHSLLANGVERELAQIILSDFSNILCFYTPPTQGHHSCGHLTPSLLGELEHLHFRIRRREFWNHAEEIHRVKAHPHHIERFVLKRKIESHVFPFTVFQMFLQALRWGFGIRA
jgi:hypothetical protein